MMVGLKPDLNLVNPTHFLYIFLQRGSQIPPKSKISHFLDLAVWRETQVRRVGANVLQPSGLAKAAQQVATRSWQRMRRVATNWLPTYARWRSPDLANDLIMPSRSSLEQPMTCFCLDQSLWRVQKSDNCFSESLPSCVVSILSSDFLREWTMLQRVF